MEIYIRECQVNDFQAIYDLNKNEMGYDYPVDLTRDKVLKLLSEKQNKIYVAVKDENVVGYIHANDYDVIYAPHMKNIMGIAVSTDFRRAGIGKMLLDSVKQWARETGASGIRLVSGANRTGAHAFYRAYGFKGNKEQLNFKLMFNER